ncbi:MAG: hypothetical protein HOJ22_08335 [Chloroflexi bacterium]|jgi:hypothetical protein|nr:hypothetical protein [Chloroflexota bacterium]MBT5628285.1 hypothetical protein [Chloroflexota bacterium]
MTTKVVSFTRRVDAPGERSKISRQAFHPRNVVVRACASNQGQVFVGDSEVTRSDPGLGPGRALGMRGYPRVDLTKVFVDGEFAGDGVEVTILESNARVGRK